MDAVKIRVQDLNLFYNETQALKNISITIENNKVVGIIGPSGCGKSTFLRCLNRMNDTIMGVRVTGTVLLDGENILSADSNRCLPSLSRMCKSSAVIS